MNALMTHIVAGYPDLKTSMDIALTMIESGIKYLEIQIPFSDPIADGPVISEANFVSLKNGTDISDCFKLMKNIRAKTDIPLFFMTYYNIPYVYGMDKFLGKTKESGGNGVIIPDIPFDEEPHTHFLEKCNKYKIDPIFVVSPNTTDTRLKQICKISKEIIYAVSASVTTGGNISIKTELIRYISKIRSFTDCKIAVGFGITTTPQIKRLSKIADIVVVGSQIIREYNKGGLAQIKKFLCL